MGLDSGILGVERWLLVYPSVLGVQWPYRVGGFIHALDYIQG